MRCASFATRLALIGSLLLAALSAAVTPAEAQTRQAFRLKTLQLRDPHVFYPLISPTTCSDLTGIVNSFIAGFIDECGPGVPEPCNQGLNLVAIFDPLLQPPIPGGDLQFGVFPTCTENGTAVACNEAPSTIISTTYTNAGAGGTCLAGIPGTTGPNNMNAYNPAVGTTGGPCFVTEEIDLTLDLSDDPPISFPLQNARIAAQFVGDPATSLISGIARGFVSEEAANAIVINVELTPGQPAINSTLAGLLRGGTGSCATAVNRGDRDTNPPDNVDGELGWWFYLAFTADPVTVPVIEIPTPTATATPANTATATPPPPTDTPLPTNTPLPTDTPLPTNTPVPTDTPPLAACPGDCNGDGQVLINEVQLTANVYLETAAVSACTAADRDGSGTVAINEVVLASRSYQFDCPVP